ncbi:hypothetical protein C0581_04230 [Candidatus Parcubacteria bacterium]|nr:MAG: hypothetical protein C0581_04230 [Candidatus Parcubacteria bacterium]
MYRAEVEAYIHEKDLQKVYFVPTGYPKGAQGFNPSLLAKDFYIDFNRLNIYNEVNSQERKSFGFSEHMNSVDTDNKFSDGGTDDDAERFMYVLDSSEEAFHTWDHNTYDDKRSEDSQQVMSQEFLDVKDDERNQIARRYVVLFASRADAVNPDYDQPEDDTRYYVDGVKNFINNNSEPNATLEFLNASQDPFNDATACEDDNGDNMLAIGMDFNKYGEFLGYVSRFCHTDGGDNGILFTVVAELNNECTEFAQVYNTDANSKETSNKAWTDRVIASNDSLFFNDTHKNLNMNQGMKPFGSLAFEDASSADFRNLNNSASLEDRMKFRSHSFSNKDFDGVPFSCAGTLFSGATSDYEGQIIYQLPDNSPIFNGEWCDPTLDTSDDEQFNLDYSSDLISGNAQSNSKGLTDASLSQGYDALHSLFISYYVKKFTGFDDELRPEFSTFDYDDPGVGLEDWSNDTNFISGTRPPQIFSINPFTCSQIGEPCEVGEVDNITVNMRNFTMNDYDGDGFTGYEDMNKDGNIDSMIGNGSYSAIVSFYAFADDNRMPIRRVMVDWGDNTDPTGHNKKGMAQNRKPYCEAAIATEDADNRVNRCSKNDTWTGDEDNINDNTDTQLTCMTDEECERAFGDEYGCVDVDERDRFGDLGRACRDEYFTYGAHTYYCTIADTLNSDNRYVKTVSYIQSLMVDEESEQRWGEVYKRLLERVKPDGSRMTPDDKICFFQPRVQVLDNWGWCNGGCSGGYGCYDNEIHTKVCTDYDLPAGIIGNPWTSYKGAIVVTPSE